jgi:Spy/CpxP family protein refolding chaperone
MKRRWIALAVSLLFLSPMAYAKEVDRKERREQLAEMKKELNLTDEQVQKIKQTRDKNQEARKTARKNAKAARDALHDAMQTDASDTALREKFKEVQSAMQAAASAHFEEALEIRKTLTPEQRKKFRSVMEKKGRHHGHMMDGPPPEDDD